jgi:hypothetical protein
MVRRIPDLSPYTGLPAESKLGLKPVAIGWLGSGQPYPTGPTPAAFPEKLLRFCLEPYTVGHHPQVDRCTLGDCPRLLPPEVRDGQTAFFGMAEIRVLGQTEIYAAPTLIYHFVIAHEYRPPKEFIDAVLNGPQPGSDEHRVLINTLNR